MYRKISFLKESIPLQKFINDIKNIYEKEKIKIISLVLSFLSIVTLYFFYQLGYTFLYGFYFGGKTEEAISIINMIVNPIPFNLKSITIIGAIILCFYIIYLVPLIIFILKDSILKRIKSYMVFLSVVFILHIFISIFLFGEFHNAFQKGTYLWILLSFAPLAIMLMIYFIKIFTKNPVYFLSNFIYCILNLGIILSVYKTKSWFSSFVLVITLSPLVMNLILNSNLDIISKYLTKYLGERFIGFSKEFFLYLSFSFFLTILCLRTISYSIILISFILNLVFCFVKIIITIKRIFKKNKDIEKYNIKEEKSGEEKLIYIPILLIYIMFVFSITTISTVYTGRSVRELTLDNSTSKIIYSSIENKSKYSTILGNVVAQKDGIYYISKYPERNLVIIKSAEIRVESYIK